LSWAPRREQPPRAMDIRNARAARVCDCGGRQVHFGGIGVIPRTASRLRPASTCRQDITTRAVPHSRNRSIRIRASASTPYATGKDPVQGPLRGRTRPPQPKINQLSRAEGWPSLRWSATRTFIHAVPATQRSRRRPLPAMAGADRGTRKTERRFAREHDLPGRLCIDGALIAKSSRSHRARGKRQCTASRRTGPGVHHRGQAHGHLFEEPLHDPYGQIHSCSKA